MTNQQIYIFGAPTGNAAPQASEVPKHTKSLFKMAMLEEKLLSFSLLREGEDEDKREDHLAEEAARKADDAAAEAESAGIDRDESEGGISNRFAGLSKAEYAELMEEAAKLQRKREDPLGERTTGRTAGPKGVIADKAWHDFQEMKKADRAAAAARAAVQRTGLGSEMALLGGPAASISLASTWSRSGSTFSSAAEAGHVAAATRASADGGGDDGDEAGGDDFMAQYKARRLAELRAKAGGSSSGSDSAGAGSSSRGVMPGAAAAVAATMPEFGDVLEVESRDDFLEKVDGAPAVSFVAVLVWEPFIRSAAHLKSVVWPQLAEAHPHVLFATAQSAMLSESIDVVGLPAIVIYRGGETVAALVRVQDSIGDESPSLEDVTDLLRGAGVQPLTLLRAARGGGGSGGGTGSGR